MLDGKRTIHQIWEAAQLRLAGDAPTQDQFLLLLGQLHDAGVLETGASPRARVGRRTLVNPLAWSVPLVDPERWLRPIEPLAKSIFTRAGLCIWFAAISTGVGLAAIHWQELTSGVLDQLFASAGAWWLWLLLPVLKLVHELGHALAVKAFGGEVREAGVCVIVLTPFPYVDASAAWGFPEKTQRILVSAAGILTDLLVATAAIVAWTQLEPGALRAALHKVILLSGVSTLFFNANPLVRLDGYYVLCDLLELPNLGTRARDYCRRLFDRYCLRVQSGTAPASVAERASLLTYATSSLAYRAVAIAGALWWVARQYFFVGALLAAAAAFSWVVVPLARELQRTLGISSSNVRARQRGIACGCVMAGVAAGLMFLVPLPLRTVAQGVVVPQEETIVRAGVDGFLVRLEARPGPVRRGDVLFVMEDVELLSRPGILEARREELLARRDAVLRRDPAAAQLLDEEIHSTTQCLEMEKQRGAALRIASPGEGILVVPRENDLPGRFFKKGEVLGYVLRSDSLDVQAAVPQDRIEWVRESAGAVEVRLSARLGSPLKASLLREVPAASTRLPGTALGTAGGGDLATDPSDSHGLRTLERVFQVELRLASPLPFTAVGARAYVRFDHGCESLAAKCSRWLRRLILEEFNA